MNLEEFQQILDRYPIVVGYFSTETCNVCKVLRPQVRQMVESTSDAHFEYIDTEKSPMLRGQYLVFSVPTIIVFVQGRETKRFNRYLSLQELEAYLQQMLELVA